LDEHDRRHRGSSLRRPGREHRHGAARGPRRRARDVLEQRRRDLGGRHEPARDTDSTAGILERPRRPLAGGPKAVRMRRGSWLVSRPGYVVAVALGPLLLLAPPAAAQTLPAVRLSVSTSGSEANGASSLMAMTPEGRVVVFWSTASNLVEGDTNGFGDLFLRD